jgi:PAS domain-containing protein
VTARRRAEQGLRASEARLAAIIDSALDAIVTVDEGQRVVLFNGAAERLFGVPAAAAIGASLDRFIPGRYHDAHRRHVADFGAAGGEPRAMASGAAGGAHGAEGSADPDGVRERAARPGTVVAVRADGTEFRSRRRSRRRRPRADGSTP